MSIFIGYYLIALVIIFVTLWIIYLVDFEANISKYAITFIIIAFLLLILIIGIYLVL